MRPILAALACAPFLTGIPTARAQTRPQPTLVLSVFGGLNGGAALWRQEGQPFLVQTLAGPDPGKYDTFDLTRKIVPGFVLGVTASYHPGPYLGYQAEVSFLGLTLESQCAIRRYQPADSADLNPQLCASLQGQTTTLSAVNVSAGVVARLSPREGGGAVSPYVRLHGGLVARPRGTIRMVGSYLSSPTTVSRALVLDDPNPRTLGVALTAAAGVAMPLGQGYQLRLEARDTYTRLDRVGGLANPSSGTLTPPRGDRFVHVLIFAVGLDVVLEQKRGRRY